VDVIHHARSSLPNNHAYER